MIMMIVIALGEARLVDRYNKSNQIAQRQREGRFILYTSDLTGLKDL
jgi:hypothetical protein